MKRLRYIALILVLVPALFVSCDDKYNDNENLKGKDYTLTSQEAVGSFAVTDDIRTLTIRGAGVTDLSTLKVHTVKNLVITETSVERIEMTSLASITVSMQITSNGSLRAIDGLPELSFVNGSVLIDGNPVLEDISSFKNPKIFTGELTISNNASLGEDVSNPGDYTYGLFPLKYLLETGVLKASVTLSNNHPLSATTVAEIGQMGAGDVLSYVITSPADAESFSPKSSAVRDLTIRGVAITDAHMAAMSARFRSVEGTITIENTSITTTENFFEVIDCQGGIVFIDNPALMNLNGLKNYTEVGGDLVIRNCPQIATNWGRGNCLTGIVTVEGSLVVRDCPLSANAFLSLETVGGNFEVVNCPEFWNFQDGFPSVIGGDLIYSDNPLVNSLIGLERVEYIGGDITITGNGSPGDPSIGDIPIQTDGPRTGMCLVAQWIALDVVQPHATVTLADGYGAAIDHNTLAVCSGFSALPDYSFTTLADLQAFIDGGDEKVRVNDFYLSIPELTDHDMSFIKTRVGRISGTATWEGMNLTTTEHFFNEIEITGSVVLRNLPQLNNANGFKDWTSAGGDFIIENCPDLPLNWGEGNCLSQLETVAGTFRLSGVQTQMSGIATRSLRSVGGDFIVTDNNGMFWNLDIMPLETIGGELIIRDNEKVNGLGGFANLTYIGGDVEIMNNGGDMALDSSANQTGLCLIKHFKDTGVIQPMAAVTVGVSSPIDIDTLSACSR